MPDAPQWTRPEKFVIDWDGIVARLQEERRNESAEARENRRKKMARLIASTWDPFNDEPPATTEESP